MNQISQFRLTGVALPANAERMLDEICEHFVEHADVSRTAELALLTSKLGTASIRLSKEKLLIELDCPSERALQLARTSLAEHMFYFAGDESLDLTWSGAAAPATVPNLHEVKVVAVENVTPHMRRVRFSCANIAPFIGGDMHVRVLIPPKGRRPVWPGYRTDGRLAWPKGEDELAVRVYTIRAVDAERGELTIDFLQHTVPGEKTPGSDFARDAQPGDVAALIGPGSGDLPKARSILMIGDESALPAIARIAAEVPAGTAIKAIIEVLDAAEEQPLPSAGNVDVRWLHRRNYPAGETGIIAEEARKAIAMIDAETFVWAACEKQDVRAIRSLLKSRQHDKNLKYVAWYWERSRAQAG
ncbi:MAG TPA: DUF2218 domain-containing protein [Pseudolabrys sp.]|nr:DUF2218 domain-containing protein [Pseudolabrys sp.]